MCSSSWLRAAYDPFLPFCFVSIKDKDFGKQALRKEHVNPPAEVSTSLKTYQHFTLEKAYLQEDFFWAFTPTAGDFIRFRFFKPLRIERPVSGGARSMEILPVCSSKFLVHPWDGSVPWEEGTVLCQGEVTPPFPVGPRLLDPFAFLHFRAIHSLLIWHRSSPSQAGARGFSVKVPVKLGCLMAHPG